MITLRQITNRNFILVHSDQPTAQAMQALHRLKAAYVIVRRWEDGTIYHYLYTAQAFLDRLAHADANQPLLEALNLHEWSATPSLNLYADAESAPARCVITEEDRVIGFYDAQVPPSQTKSTRGESKGISPAEAPVTRSLHTDFPETLENGQTESLLVWLVRALSQKPAGSFTAQLGTQIDIVVYPEHGFVLEGTRTRSLDITDEDETPPIQFKLRATEIGPGRIRVLAFQGGQSIGEVTRTPLIVAAGENTTAGSSDASQLLELHPIAQPDLMLLIKEKDVLGGKEISLTLNATDPALGFNYQEFGPILLKTDPRSYFQNFFTEIDSLKTDTREEKVIAGKRLASRCAGLFKSLLPKALGDKLWEFRDRIRTVQVQSDDPSIPWELLKLQGVQDGKVMEGPYLCEAFAMTRWFTGTPRVPTLHLQRMAIIVPSDDSRVTSANEERTYLLSLADAQRKRQVIEVPANFLDVVDALTNNQYDSLHFTGHGRFNAQDPNRSAIILEGNYPENVLGPIDLNIRNYGPAKPLVFLNACQTGQQALSLTGIGGWAKQFVGAGAAGFIGSFWSVYDDAACAFAKAVYNHLLAGEPIGQAVQEARKVIKPREDMAWLAYTVFADPFAKVV